MLQRLLGKLYGKKNADTSAADKSAENESSEDTVETEGILQPVLDSDPPASQASTVNTGATEKPVEERSKETESSPVEAAAEGDVDTEALQTSIVEALKTIYDPEIPINIYALGLIYEVKVEPTGMAYVTMTLTAPNCPAAGILPGQVESKARSVDGVYDVNLDLTFEPPWTPDRMSDAAKLELGML